MKNFTENGENFWSHKFPRKSGTHYFCGLGVQKHEKTSPTKPNQNPRFHTFSGKSNFSKPRKAMEIVDFRLIFCEFPQKWELPKIPSKIQGKINLIFRKKCESLDFAWDFVERFQQIPRNPLKFHRLTNT